MTQTKLHKFSFDESLARYRRGVIIPGKCRKNLANLLPEEDEEEAPTIAHVKVFLRIKPLQLKEKAAFYVKDDHTLITYPPDDDHLSKFKLKSSQYGFQFSKIYGPEVTQKEIFEGSVLPLVNDFLKGKDALLFAYGTSSAGKTFTMQGDEKHPGVIPRALDVLFNSLLGKIMVDIRYKPTSNDNIEILSDEDADAEYKLKDAILKWNPQSVMEGSLYYQSVLIDNTTSESSLGETSSGAPSSMNGSRGLCIPESLKRERNSIFLPGDKKDVQYSIWVSFAEIYNEAVYDLLDFLPGKGPPSNMKRPKLNLVTDHHGNTYIKGLQEVCVSSGDEACQVMLLGKCNLHFAATKLNHKSSRSHCVFTIKLLRKAESDGSDFKISTLSFCDLAGSERVEKSGNVGERLKETGNINTSLLVLGRCLKGLKKNQSESKNLTRVPFRESKLTRMFQNALTGNGNVAMIANVSQSPILFEETLNVLKYAAVAQEIVLMPMEIHTSRLNNTKNKFSILAAKHQKQSRQDSIMILDQIQEDASSSSDGSFNRLTEEIESLREENDNLKFQLEESERECKRRENAVRVFLCTKYGEMMDDMKEKHQKTVEDIKSDLEDYYTTKIEIIEEINENKIKKLLLKLNSVNNENEKPLEDINKEDNTNELESTIHKLTLENNNLKAEMEKLIVNHKEIQDDHDRMIVQKEEENSQMKSENSSLKFELDVLQKKVQELEETLQDGYIECANLTETVTNLEKELNDKNQLCAQMELEITQLKEENEVSDNLLQEVNRNLERKEGLILKLEKELLSKESSSSVAIQCDLSDEECKKKEELENSLAEMEKKVKCNVAYYDEIIRGKDSEISHLEKSFKSLLNQKNELENKVMTLETENSGMSNRIILVEKELTESSKMLREVCIEKRESKKSMVDDSETKKESIKMLNLLKEELEMKRSDNERLLNETQALRDAVDCKEQELLSFQENQARTLSSYEMLLNKARDEVDLHKREEKKLRELLQIGTPNKYEKKCESLNEELLKLKKTLNQVLCKECSARIPPEDQAYYSFRDRSDISNENFDPRARSMRRRSKSHTNRYIFEDSDDSDFMIEKDKPRGRKAHANKTFAGHDANKEPQNPVYARPLSVERTPFKSSRRLMNPSDCSTLSDLMDNMPLYPRTPADVIKRVLRPRRK